MKRVIIGLVLFSSCLSVLSTDLMSFSNGSYNTILGDSLLANDSDGVGTRVVSEIQAGEIALHPTIIAYFFNGAGSGQIPDGMVTNAASVVGFYGYQSNSADHNFFWNQTDNTGQNTNLAFATSSNMCMFPIWSTTNGAFPLTLSKGNMTNGVNHHYTIGYPPANVADGSASGDGQRSGASFAAATLYGNGGMDTWLDRVLVWTNDIVNNAAANIGFNGSGHILEGGSFDQYINFKRRFTASDTNVSFAVIDFTTGTVTSTNNTCVVNVSKSSGSITWNQLDNCLAPPFFVPRQDGTLTNDSRPAFTLDPLNAIFFRFATRITGLPSGSYNVKIDGTLCGVVTASTFTSAQGWNQFTNVVGPIWTQREEILLRVLDWRYVDRKTLIPKSAGDGIGEVSVGSFSFTGMTQGKRGDDLIAFLNAKMTDIQTNYLPQYPQSMYAVAPPVIHTFSVTPQFVPAPFR